MCDSFNKRMSFNRHPKALVPDAEPADFHSVSHPSSDSSTGASSTPSTEPPASEWSSISATVAGGASVAAADGAGAHRGQLFVRLGDALDSPALDHRLGFNVEVKYWTPLLVFSLSRFLAFSFSYSFMDVNLELCNLL